MVIDGDNAFFKIANRYFLNKVTNPICYTCRRKTGISIFATVNLLIMFIGALFDLLKKTMTESEKN